MPKVSFLNQKAGWVDVKDIDVEFEEFVHKNYQQLTENQRRLCEKLGIIP